MKKTIKLLGIIVLAALIGFTMMACSDDDGGNDKEATYIVYAFTIDNADFPGAIPASVGEWGYITTNNIPGYKTAVDNLYNNHSTLDIEYDTGVLYSEIESDLPDFEGALDSTNRAKLLNDLKNNGYVMAVYNIDDARSIIVAAFKE